jgi:hypothetical protein
VALAIFQAKVVGRVSEVGPSDWHACSDTIEGYLAD